MIQYDLPAIRELLLTNFDDSELRDLCFQLHVDYEIISGNNKKDKARELLTFLNRRGNIAELVYLCRQERPKINWNILKTTLALNNEFANDLGLTSTISTKYYEAKFELYRSVWQTLYELKEAGDILWERASRENIAHFAACLQKARWVIGANEILFDQVVYIELSNIMEVFGQFRAGKVRLIQIRSEDAERHIFADEILNQIEENREIKEKYEALLHKVGDRFRKQLNVWAEQ